VAVQHAGGSRRGRTAEHGAAGCNAGADRGAGRGRHAGRRRPDQVFTPDRDALADARGTGSAAAARAHDGAAADVTAAADQDDNAAATDIHDGADADKQRHHAADVHRRRRTTARLEGRAALSSRSRLRMLLFEQTLKRG
jgi:hypothetical protein